MQYVCPCMRVPGGAGSTPCRYTCACVHACGGLELFLLKCVPFYHYCELASKKGTCDQKSHNTGRLLPPLEKVCSSLVSNTHQARTRFELCEPGFWREQRAGQTHGRLRYRTAVCALPDGGVVFLSFPGPGDQASILLVPMSLCYLTPLGIQPWTGITQTTCQWPPCVLVM